MKRMISGVVVMMGLAAGCATSAPTQQASGPTAQTQQAEKTAAADAKKDPGKTLICEEVAVTGSHIPRKICRTVQQAQKEREQAEKAIRDSDKINREFGK